MKNTEIVASAAPTSEQVQHALKDVETGRATYKTADLLRSHIAELEQARDAALATDAALASLIEAIHQHFAGGSNGRWTADLARRVSAARTMPHPGAATFDELETLRDQRALFDAAAHALYGYTEFIGPCAHGRCPWDRCDECGEGTSVAAAQKVIVKMTEEHRRDYLKAEKRADDAEAEVDRLAEEHCKALARAARWKAAAKRVWQRAVDLGQVCAGLHQVLNDINAWIRTYDATWMYPAPDFLLPRLKQLVADREQAALAEADQRILATAQPPDFLREHHPERREYEAVMSGYSVGVNHGLDTIRRMIKVKKAIKPL